MLICYKEFNSHNYVVIQILYNCVFTLQIIVRGRRMVCIQARQLFRFTYTRKLSIRTTSLVSQYILLMSSHFELSSDKVCSLDGIFIIASSTDTSVQSLIRFFIPKNILPAFRNCSLNICRLTCACILTFSSLDLQQ